MKRIASVLLVMILSLFVQAVGAQDTISTWVTVQKFERGMMMWRSDNSTIWVLASDGRYKTFPAGSYSNYKDNVITTSPTGRVPTLGFGKVWGNFSEIRRLIGSPISGESGIAMNIRYAGGDYSLTQIDGTSYSIRNDGRWVGFYTNQPPTPQPAVNVWVSIQKFERGFMIWRSDNSTIWVLGMNGQLQTWPASAYSRLPENTILNNPFGYNPVFGFGKVWGNNASVRDLLGWALDAEGGLSMSIQPSNGGYKLTQPNGTLYTLQADNRWVGSYTPPSGQPRIVNFTITPDKPVAAVDAITMQWEVSGTTHALIEIYEGGTNTLLISYKDLNLSGTERFTTPRITTNQLRLVIAAVNKTATGYERKATLEKIVTVTPNADPYDVKIFLERWTNGSVGVGDTLTAHYSLWGTNTALLEVYDDTNTLLLSQIYPSLPVPGLDIGTITFKIPPTSASKLRLVLSAVNVLTTGYERKDSNETTLTLRTAAPAVNTLTAPTAAKSGDNLQIDWDVVGTQAALLEIYDGDSDTLLLSHKDIPLKGSKTIVVPVTTSNKLRIVVTAANVGVAGYDRKASKQVFVSLAAPSADVPTAQISVAPESASSGSPVTVSWTVTGASNALIEVFDGDAGSILSTSQTLEASGTIALTLPVSNASKLRVVVTGVFVGIAGYERRASSEVSVTLTRPTTSAETLTIYAAYQAFEHGFMIWRSDNDDVYVFGSTETFFDSSAGLVDNTETAPSGTSVVAPINAFGRIWANNAQIKSDLGWAVAAEQGYNATITVLPGQTLPQSITLPDGRTVPFGG